MKLFTHFVLSSTLSFNIHIHGYISYFLTHVNYIIIQKFGVSKIFLFYIIL